MVGILGSSEDGFAPSAGLLDQFGGTGSGETISFTQGARLKVEQLLKQLKSKL
jgi:hypothetical protein